VKRPTDLLARLLGANDGDERGVLFGWSTAVVFEVLRKTMTGLGSEER
jgi:hypothetical protein